MSPIKRKGVFYLHVPNRHGGWTLRSTRTRDAGVYRGMRRMIAELRDKRRWALLDAMISGRLSIGTVYDAHTASTLDTLEASLSASSLTTQLPAYAATLKARGKATKYISGVRHKVESFIASGAATTADLVPATVTRWLAGLTVSPGTRRQYLFAVTGFTRYLFQTGVIPMFPLTGLEAPKKNAARMRYETEANDRRICEAASPKYRALFAFIKATGCDVSTAFRTRRRHVELERGVAELLGTKTTRRHVQEGLIEAWAVPLLTAYCADVLPNALLWPPGSGKPGAHGRGVTPRYSVSGAGHHHEKTCEALGIEGYTLKDARHSVAVRMARAGYTPFEIAEQLGTSADLVADVYARFIVKLTRRAAEPATNVIPHVIRAVEGADR